MLGFNDERLLHKAVVAIFRESRNRVGENATTITLERCRV
jgi:hypothetical protein